MYLGVFIIFIWFGKGNISMQKYNKVILILLVLIVMLVFIGYLLDVVYFRFKVLLYNVLMLYGLENNENDVWSFKYI